MSPEMSNLLRRLAALPTPPDMLEGYLDGFGDERPDYPEQSNRSEAYRHGWLNGRDDRVGTPRQAAPAIAEEAIRIIERAA